MKKKDKLVSVVVQAYNSADTIVRTLESVKAQDYEKIELIVTDDKSTDQTIEEVAAWLEKNQEACRRISFSSVSRDAALVCP